MMFKIGEIALTQNCIRHPNNVEVEVLSELRLIATDTLGYHIIYNDMKYSIVKENLKKLPPPNTKTNWEDGVWMPSTIKQTETEL